jgi:GTP-binding protein
MPYPIAAIVGRPNVGKSTFFNRVLGDRSAITAEEAGTTRDRLFANVEWNGRRFALVDTAGLDLQAAGDLEKAMMNQARLAIDEADVIIFMVDVNDGVTPADTDVADLLRRSGKRVVLAANKADNPRRELGAAEFYTLGLGDPLAISAYHNFGVGEVLDAVVASLSGKESEPEETGPEGMRLAIVGRPNAGKSQLLNAFTGTQRAVVSEVPGTTRDSVDTVLRYDGKTAVLIDTAGIRKRGRIEVGIEKFSTMRAIRAIERCDIALLLLEPRELAAAQDLHIAGYVLEAYKGLIILVNKWDLADELGLSKPQCEALIRARFRFAPFAPIVFTSGLKGIGLKEVLRTAETVYAERNKRVPTAALNRVMERAAAENLPRMFGKTRLHLLYATHAEVNPPTFVFFVNSPKLVHFAYRRYLENRLREEFGFTGTPIRFVFKGREEAA